MSVWHGDETIDGVVCIATQLSSRCIWHRIFIHLTHTADELHLQLSTLTPFDGDKKGSWQ